MKEQDTYVQTKTGTHRQVSGHTWVANPNRARRAKVHLPGDAPKKPVTKAKTLGPSLQGLKPRNQRGRINNEDVEKAKMKVQHAQDKLDMAKDHKSDKTRLNRTMPSLVKRLAWRKRTLERIRSS